MNLRLTADGLAAVAAAHGMGVAAKITHVALGDATGAAGYEPDGTETELENERVRVELEAGGALGPRQVLLQGTVPAGGDQFFIREMGYFLEDGTLLAIWSAPADVLGWVGGETPWFFKLVFAWAALPDGAVTVIFNGDAGDAAMALDLARLEGKVRHTVEAASIAWDDGDNTQLTEAILSLIRAGAHTVIVDAPAFAPGVADGNAVRWDSGNNRFALAIADGTANNRVVGFADVAEGKVYCFGLSPAGLFSGLTPGARYYLSGADAGAIVGARPNDGVSVGIAKAANLMFIDIDAVTVSGIGKHTVTVPAIEMDPTITNGCGYYSRVEVGANQPEIRYLPFDPTVEESCEFVKPVPKSWDGGPITARAIWSHGAAATYGVAWGFKAAFLGNDDAKALNFGAEVIVTDAGGTTNDTYVTDTTAAIMPSGVPADHGLLVVRVSRKVADAGDTLNVDARLEDVDLDFTTNAATDD